MSKTYTAVTNLGIIINYQEYLAENLPDITSYDLSAPEGIYCLCVAEGDLPFSEDQYSIIYDYIKNINNFNSLGDKNYVYNNFVNSTANVSDNNKYRTHILTKFIISCHKANRNDIMQQFYDLAEEKEYVNELIEVYCPEILTIINQND